MLIVRQKAGNTPPLYCLSFAALELLEALRQLPKPVQVVTRLRLDAALYHPAPERQAKQLGRPRKVGKRLPTLKALIDHPYTPWYTVVLRIGMVMATMP